MADPNDAIREIVIPKRYDLVTNYRCGSSIEEMKCADDGEWVRWEDIEAALAARDEELTKVREENATLAATLDEAQRNNQRGVCVCLLRDDHAVPVGGDPQTNACS